MKTLWWISMVLVVIGAINWGLIGLFNFDLVATIFGTMSAVTRVIYTLVGLGGLYIIIGTFSMEESGVPRRASYVK